MNKRIMLGVLAGGVIAIASLVGFCIFKMHGFKQKFEETLNDNLAQISQEVALNEAELDYTPFQCQGLFFIECKSSYVSFTPLGFKEAVFSSRNLTLSLKEIDFKSITLGAESQLQYTHLGDLQEYAQAFLPNDFQLDLTIKPQDTKSYTMHTKLLLNAKNAQYTEEFTSLIDSPKVQELGLFRHIGSLAFLDEGMQIKNLELSLISKNLSDTLFEIAQSKYGKSLNRKAYNALAAFLAGASIQPYSKKPYYTEIRDLVGGLLEIVTGDQNKMQVSISPKNDQSIQTSQDLDTMLEAFFSNYSFNITLSK